MESSKLRLRSCVEREPPDLSFRSLEEKQQARRPPVDMELDYLMTRRSISPISSKDRRLRLGLTRPKQSIEHTENPHHFPLPDTKGLEYCGRVSKFFFTFRFEELPYWDTVFKTADDLDRAKRFLMQVRQTGGYGVDCRPPPPLKSPFVPRLDLEQYLIDYPHRYEYEFMRPVNFAIKEISKEEGLNLEFVELVNVVTTVLCVDFYTFKVRVKDQSEAPIQTVQALVGDESAKYIHLIEWRGLNSKPLLLVSHPSGSAVG